MLLHATQNCHHVCRYHGITQKDDKFLIVMALYKGGSLAAHLTKQPGRKLGMVPALNILRDICRGLQELHSCGVAVLDLKPDNVLMTQSGSAVLSDFGISRIVTGTIGVTKQSGVMGTFQYMPPEQFDDKAYVGIKCDMWALACTLIHMVNGEAPMARLNMIQIVTKVGHGPLDLFPTGCQTMPLSHITHDLV